MIWNVPQFGSADADYLRLVGDCLGEGKTSRLYKRLVYDDQIASDVTVYNDSREIGGQFHIEVTARVGHSLDQIEKEINEEVARFLKDGPTPEELQRVQTQYLAGFLRGIERIGGFGGKSDRLAEYMVFTGNPDGYKITLQRIREATANNLKSAANRWLSDGVYEVEVQPFPEYKTASSELDRSKTPALGTPPELKLPKLQRASLSNGLKVILAERHEVPLVGFWMAADAGYAADQFAKPGYGQARNHPPDGRDQHEECAPNQRSGGNAGSRSAGLFQSRLLLCKPLRAEDEARPLARFFCRCDSPPILSGS